MAGAQRKPDPALSKAIADGGHQFGFFAAVHLLHRLRESSVPVGELGPPSAEPVRFGHSSQLTFHAGDVEQIELRDDNPARLTSTFLGLYGASSPMPVQFCEDVISAEEADEPTLRAFYDLFHHRLISLYYRAWKKYRLHTSFRETADDIGSKRIQCFVGLDGHGAAAESGLSRMDVLAMAPLLAMRARPPRVLALALKRLFPELDVKIEQFVMRRAGIDEADRMQLGRSNNSLGDGYTLGAGVTDRSARFRIVFGPVDYDRCEDLMPGGAKYPVMRRAVEQFTRGTLECEVDVILDAKEAPGFCLGSRRGGSLGVSTRLGRGGGGGFGKQSRMRTVISNDSSEARSSLVEISAF